MFRTLLRAAPHVMNHIPRIAMSGAVVAVLHLACTGVISDGHGMTGGGHGGSNPTGGSSGGGSPTGGVGVGGSGPATGPLDPGHVPLRRLNRAEYCNTVRDLLGTTQRPCDKFPEDNAIFGFDTIASVQSVSSLHVELYEQAATALIDEVMALPATDPRRTRIFTCQPAADPKPCATQILKGFAERAYRRPVAADEVADHVGLLDLAKAQAGTVEDGLRLGLRAILLSPNFLFRVEIDPMPDSPAVHPVGNYELASRMSYSLWSTMPDDALLSAAAGGAIQTPAELDRQVARMLTDPKSHAITTDFIGQWLALRDMAIVDVNAIAFPAFDPALRSAMSGETERFFDEFLRSQAPATDILTADFTYVNARLATHYGMTPPAGTDFARVSLTGGNRRGMLMQGSILTVTSYPNRTSPVARGIWVLGRLLCSEPSPPPADVPKFPEVPPGTMPDQTMRERLAAHRIRPDCAACHNSIDPIGLGLENFDGIGRYRTTEAGKTIDSAGMLPDGTKFSGPAELAAILKQPDRGFQACLTRKMLTFMVGRGFDDQTGVAWSTKVSEAAHASGDSFGAVVANVVKSGPFTQRRGETP